LRPKPDITIVIPSRERHLSEVLTIQSLKSQTYRLFNVVFTHDCGNGSNWARNKGFNRVNTPLVLFSDDDIEWEPDAIERLKITLDSNPGVSYSYGSFMRDEELIGNCPFDEDKLKHYNYINTSSLIRSKDFPGFDLNIKRLQDWDLWLTMLENGKTGVYCGGGFLFKTKTTPSGITSPNNPLTYEEAKIIVKKKHGLP
jgi:glycosyltransferase involved in cell wall biosynthesis